MPRVTGGWLEFGDGGRPDQGLPGGNRPGGRPGGGNRPGGGVDPDWGIDEGEGGGGHPDQGLPEPPPGVWPGPTPSHPIVPVPPDEPAEPGTIWPPAPSSSGKFWVVAGIPGHGWRYICIDVSLKPDQGLPSGGGEHPQPPMAPGGQPSQPIQPGGQPQPLGAQRRR